MTTTRSLRGFTLIELLIVVAIIAILAAIAVPNFLEAQTRSKVARVKADLRTQATAITAYLVDYNTLPRDSDSSLDTKDQGIRCADVSQGDCANGALQLTTPIAYMSSLLTDPFAVGQSVQLLGGAAQGYRIGSGTWAYPSASYTPDHQNSFETQQQYGRVLAFVVLSPGPDKERCRISYKSFPWRPNSPSDEKTGKVNHYQDYDPTNGTVSSGDIYRFGGSFLSGNWRRNGDTAGPAGPEQY